ncbi:hypothetical protein AB0E11_20800 [Streptomyces fradiae]|uniref:hypothetical protein n=1 Tax=Streptomyces fradiae TaxID=1906 RepID=UPI0033C9C524
MAADIDRELPGLSDRERRRVLEERLREQAAAERALAAAQEEADRERQAADAAEAARQALPCQDCGLAQSAELCEACGYRRTEAAIVEAGLVAAIWSAAGEGLDQEPGGASRHLPQGGVALPLGRVHQPEQAPPAGPAQETESEWCRRTT